MLTLEKIMTELKVNSVHEVVGGRHGNSNSRSRSRSRNHSSHERNGTHRRHHSGRG